MIDVNTKCSIPLCSKFTSLLKTTRPFFNDSVLQPLQVTWSIHYIGI